MLVSDSHLSFSLFPFSAFPILWWCGRVFIMWHANEKSSAITGLLAALIDPRSCFMDMRHSYKSRFCMWPAYYITEKNYQEECLVWYLSTYTASYKACVVTLCVYLYPPQVSFSRDPALQLTPLSPLTAEFNSEKKKKNTDSLPNHYKGLIQSLTNNHAHTHALTEIEGEIHTDREWKRETKVCTYIIDCRWRGSWWKQSCGWQRLSIMQIVTKQQLCVC